MIGKARLALAVLMTFQGVAWAQALHEAPQAAATQQPPAEHGSGTADVAIGQYYLCVKTFALRFAKTKESAGDIADAALSSCMPQSKILSDQAVKMYGSVEPAMNVIERITVNARRYSIQTVLEARYPAN
ncbi:MAG: hypothetical protein ACREPT_04780 [Rudaea sp.]